MNILIVKLSSLGDVVQTMPVIADLKQAFPDCQIDWVVEEAFAPLVARVQGVNRVIPIALRRWRKDWFSTTVRQERKDFKLSVQSQLYEAVIDCQGLIKSALVARLARLTGRALRGSFANKSDACGYEWPVKFLLPNNQATPRRIHAIARTRLLTAKLLDYQNHQPAQVDFQDLPTQTGDHQTMMLTHGTTRSDNEWPLASWIELVAKCVVAGYRIVVPQANDAELQFAKALQKQFPEQLQILPRLNLSQLLVPFCQGGLKLSECSYDDMANFSLKLLPDRSTSPRAASLSCRSASQAGAARRRPAPWRSPAAPDPSASRARSAPALRRAAHPRAT